MSQTLKVRSADEGLFRFYVQGVDQPEYLVDLSNFFGAGECGCPSFEFRHAPLLKLGKTAAMAKLGITEDQWPPMDGVCKHIQAAYTHFGRELAVKLAVEASKQQKHHEES